MKYLFPSIWLCLIVFASLIPSDKIPDFTLFLHADKVVHFCMYFGFSFLIIPLLTIQKNYFKSFYLSFLISVLIGILMECFQYFTKIGRSAEFFDFLANIFGSIAGIVIYQLTVRNKKLENKIFRI